MEDSQPDPEPEPASQAVLDVQIACADTAVPTKQQMLAWYRACLPESKQHYEMTVRVVDPNESHHLNATFRHKDKPTNVLSFPSDIPSDLGIPFLGDLVICAEIVKREAQVQQKLNDAHWAHMIVHGTLHLLGHNHEQDTEAEIMESLETRILVGLGFDSPYEKIEQHTLKGNLQ